eukprot:CAMPEP_0171785122 /NCGR_PEP_ID=MMETSP0991-20121206/62503_1 /TAXON_ID=483369 /ORGANISM="non described non described, Strain CCMP2098" /LENGTH=78 /DNA_ID=CAMNT_0012393595 /DNA_START=16 /DNA_END=252 /DNA_ORIENTATION=-
MPKKKKKKLRNAAVTNVEEEVTIQDDDTDFTSKPNYTCFSQLVNLMEGRLCEAKHYRRKTKDQFWGKFSPIQQISTGA